MDPCNRFPPLPVIAIAAAILAGCGARTPAPEPEPRARTPEAARVLAEVDAALDQVPGLACGPHCIDGRGDSSAEKRKRAEEWNRKLNMAPGAFVAGAVRNISGIGKGTGATGDAAAAMGDQAAGLVEKAAGAAQDCDAKTTNFRDALRCRLAAAQRITGAGK